MNNNEMNTQNFPNMQPVGPNPGMPAGQIQNPAMQPVPAAPSQAMMPPNMATPNVAPPPVTQTMPMNNFMENFADAVIQKPEPIPAVMPSSQMNIPVPNMTTQVPSGSVEGAFVNQPTLKEETMNSVSLNPNMEAMVQQEMPKVEQPVASVETTNPVPLDPNMEAMVQQEMPKVEQSVANVETTNPVPLDSNMEAMVQQEMPKMEQPVANVETTNPVSLDSNTEATVKQDAKKKKVSSKKEESHWKFILILFAIVGLAVLLFPVFVHFFGY